MERMNERAHRNGGGILDLPFDAIEHLVQWLSVRAFVTLGCTCHALNAALLADDRDHMWRILFVRDFAGIYYGEPVMREPWTCGLHPAEEWPQEATDEFGHIAWVQHAQDMLSRALPRKPLPHVPPPWALCMSKGKTWKWLYRCHATVISPDDPRRGTFTGPGMLLLKDPVSHRAGYFMGDIYNGERDGYGTVHWLDQKQSFMWRGQKRHPITQWSTGIMAGTNVADVVVMDSKTIQYTMVERKRDPRFDAHLLRLYYSSEMATLCAADRRAGASDGQELVFRERTFTMWQSPLASRLWGVERHPLPGTFVEVQHDGRLARGTQQRRRRLAVTARLRNATCTFSYDNQGRRHGEGIARADNGDVVRGVYLHGITDHIIEYTVSPTCPRTEWASRRIQSTAWRRLTIPASETRRVRTIIWPVGDTPDVRAFWAYVESGLIGWEEDVIDAVLALIRTNSDLPFGARAADPAFDVPGTSWIRGVVSG